MTLLRSLMRWINLRVTIRANNRKPDKRAGTYDHPQDW